MSKIRYVSYFSRGGIVGVQQIFEVQNGKICFLV